MVAEVKGTTSSIVAGTAHRSAPSETPTVTHPPQAGAVSNKNVHLTDAAAELRTLETAVHEAPDVDIERVNSIRQAIADGSYEIDPQKLADNLLRFELLMSARTHK